MTRYVASCAFAAFSLAFGFGQAASAADHHDLGSCADYVVDQCNADDVDDQAGCLDFGLDQCEGYYPPEKDAPPPRPGGTFKANSPSQPLRLRSND